MSTTFGSETWWSSSESSKAFQVVSDESLAPGGCVVEARRTQVDASLETQTREIAALLLGRGGQHG